jgi:hypothetical protein
MLLRLTINGLRIRVLIFHVKNGLAAHLVKDVWETGALQTIEWKEQE